MEVKLHSFIAASLHGGKWSALRLGRFLPGKTTICYVELVQRRFGKEEDFLPLPEIEPLFLGRPVHNPGTVPTLLSRHRYRP